MANRAREERGKGVPLDDAQRVARHYGVSIQEACDLLAVYSVEELLPERGYGLITGSQLIGYTVDDLRLSLDAMEDSLPSGGKASLQLCTERMPTEEELAEAYLQMTAAGFHLSYPTASLVEGVPTTQLVLTKGSPQWSLLIPIVPTLFVVGLIAFGITRIEAIGKAILPIFITAVVGLVAIAGLMRTTAGRVAERAAERYLPKSEKKALAAR
jgi:hypothetical protein